MIGNFALNDSFFWFSFLYFGIAVFISNYIPGSLLLHKLKIDTLSKIVLSIILGIVLWGYQGYLFGYLGFRSGSYIYLLVCVLVWLWIRRHNRFKVALPSIKNLKKSLLLILLISLGTFVQLVSTWFHGISLSQGLYFCCGIDGIYHLALTQELVKTFPPHEPGTFNTVVENYHYFSNMIVAEWIRVFHLPLTATYFQYATVLLSLLMGAVAVTFGKTLGLSRKYIYWFVFFVYFSASATYLIILFSRHIFDFHSIVLYDATILWASPPRVYGIVVFLAGLSLFQVWLKSKKMYAGILSGILFGCLISIKVYFGLFVLAGLCILDVYFLYKRNLKALLPSIITLIFSLLLYLPINKESGGLFFVGMWRFENFIVFPALGLLNLELARTTYLSQGNWIRVVVYEIIFAILYFIATFGTLLVSIIQNPGSLRQIRKELHIFLVGGITLSLGAGMFFIQDTGGANSSQFIMTVIAIVAIYAALAVDYWTSWIKNKVVRFIFVLLIVLLTIPRIVNDTYTQLSEIAHLSDFVVATAELDALTVLRNASSGTILTSPYDCLYITILANKPVYACNDAGVLTDHKVKNGKERLRSAELLYSDINKSHSEGKLKSQGIKYVYIKKSTTESTKKYAVPVLFENSKIIILEVVSR
jgi:hypothetical protein